MSEFKIEKDIVNRILKVTLSGGFRSAGTVQDSLNQYDNLLSNMNAKEYSLLLDCTDCSVYEQVALQQLEQIYKRYMQTGFKHIVFVNAKNPIQNMQLKKVAKNIPGFPGVFLPTLSDAIKECKK